MSNYKNIYAYFCITENKWIYEERNRNAIPNKCINDDAHNLRIESIYLYKDNFCNFIDDNNIPESFSLVDLDYNNLSSEGKKIVEIIRALLKCAKYRGLVKM